MQISSSTRRRVASHFVLIFVCLSLLILFSGTRTEKISHAQDNINPSVIRFSENFDNTVAPALPAGWTTSRTGANLAFFASQVAPDTVPNVLFTDNPPTAGSAQVTSPPFLLGNSRARLTFRHNYRTDFQPGYDGGVLEISANGEPFQDILAAGGSFAGGGYVRAISPEATGNPLIGRMTWTGDPNGYATTIVDLPPNFANQSVRLRWLYGTSNSVGGFGWQIDNVKVEDISPTIVTFSENFDNVSAPNLPPNWTLEGIDPLKNFRTHTERAYSLPNSVFVPAAPPASTAAMISPSIRIGENSPKLVFHHLYLCDQNLKGGVLEISINGGAFQDIIAAGGSFVYGGYSGTLNANSGNPLPGRPAWTGSTNGFIITEINLPPSAYRQNVRFKWLFANNSVILSIGWWVDAIQVIESISGENPNGISIPAAGVAQPYPSEIQVNNHEGLITSVRVALTNFSHTSPDDVDLMLVAPSGRKVVLMSDAGGSSAVGNLSLSFADAAVASLPDNAPLVSGSYKPTNFEPGDDFPAPSPAGAPAGNMLSVLNGDEPNGVWKLFLVDDNGNNAGNVTGGWNLNVQTAPNVVVIPASGAAQPYPSEFVVSGLPGAVSKVTVNLSNFSHTSPDDADLMLVAPNGRRIILMSDVGGSAETGGLNLIFDDDAPANLPDNAPLVSGTFKPTNFETGDVFPAPAPPGAPTGTTLNNFFGAGPNGVWKLFVVDDTGANFGSIAGGWSLDIQSSIGACQFSLSSSAQAFPATGGSGGFNVQMPAGCPWTASSNSAFISLTAGSSGEGDGAIAFTVAPNQGPARTGSIVVTNGAFSRMFQVQQASGCPFAINQTTMNFSSAGGNGSVEVSAGAECGWQSSSNVPWIFITSAPQTGNGTTTFNVQPNPGAGGRSGTITIGALTVTVIQSGTTGRRFDFDGDGKADISVYRNGNWYLLQSADGFVAAQFGIPTDKIVPADYDGDRKTDLAVFRDGNWYILQSSNSAFLPVQFGVATDQPVPADYNGDGRDELAVYRGGTWYTLDLTTNQTTGVQFGIAGDKPVVADYDGDGRADPAVYRDGVWYLLRSTQGVASVPFGIASDKPVVGDYDADGRADQAVYRDGNWYINRSSDGQFVGVQFGIASDTPVQADYDGDGKTDLAVFRDGNWYLLRSQQGFGAVQFGLTSDIPVPSAFLP